MWLLSIPLHVDDVNIDSGWGQLHLQWIQGTFNTLWFHETRGADIIFTGTDVKFGMVFPDGL